ncbi:hypothetical protein BES34_019310 [Leptospira inadai serovar Lyme]|uniref:Uncharacterized protein n=1 Tax=Leptospira inadai serovar Lyme TaxID=293084 RepID=A0ABX4YDN7_9LEPT|nr:hypothetical protein BES34_019310 [Leptospira inadai serovar Lyme]
MYVLDFGAFRLEPVNLGFLREVPPIPSRLARRLIVILLQFPPTRANGQIGSVRDGMKKANLSVRSRRPEHPI